MKNFSLGLLAEYLIALIYIFKFYKILHHRKRNYLGEIDLIMTRGKEIVFIEVKARKYGLSDKTIYPSQQKRIKRAAELFLSQNNSFNNYDVRFDLAVISPYKLPLIIENAW